MKRNASNSSSEEVSQNKHPRIDSIFSSNSRHPSSVAEKAAVLCTGRFDREVKKMKNSNYSSKDIEKFISEFDTCSDYGYWVADGYKSAQNLIHKLQEDKTELSQKITELTKNKENHNSSVNLLNQHSRPKHPLNQTHSQITQSSGEDWLKEKKEMEAKLKKYKADLENLNAHYKANFGLLTFENKDLLQKEKDFTEKESNLQEEIGKFKKYYEGAQKAADEYGSKLHEAESQIKIFVAEKRQYENLIREKLEIEERLFKVELERVSADQRARNFEAEKIEKEEELKQLQKKYETDISKFQNEIESSIKELENTKAAVNKLENDKAALSSEMEKIKLQAAENTPQRATTSERIQLQGLRTKKLDLEQRVKEANSKISDLESKIKQLESSNLELTNQLKNIELNNHPPPAAANQELEDAKAVITTRENDLQNLQKRYNELFKDSSEKLCAAKTKIDEIQKATERLKEEKAIVKAEVEKEKAQTRAEFDRVNNECKIELEKAELELHNLQQSYKNLLKESSEKLNAAKIQIDQLHEEAKKLEGEKLNLKTKMEAEKSQTKIEFDRVVAESEAKLEKAELEYKKLQENIQNLIEQLNAKDKIISDIKEKKEKMIKGILNGIKKIKALVKENAEIKNEKERMEEELKQANILIQQKDQETKRAVANGEEEQERLFTQKLQNFVQILTEFQDRINSEPENFKKLRKAGKKLLAQISGLETSINMDNKTAKITMDKIDAAPSSPSSPAISAAETSKAETPDWLVDKKTCKSIFRNCDSKMEPFLIQYFDKLFTCVEFLLPQKKLPKEKMMEARRVLQRFWFTTPEDVLATVIDALFTRILEKRRIAERQNYYSQCNEKRSVAVTSTGEKIYYKYRTKLGKFTPYSDLDFTQKLERCPIIFQIEKYEVPKIYKKVEYILIFEKSSRSVIKRMHPKGKWMEKFSKNLKG